MAQMMDISGQDVMKAFERANALNAQLSLVNIVLERQVEELRAEIAKLKEKPDAPEKVGK